MDAYVAMGGDEDGGGYIDAERLIRIIKEDFEMTIDIEKLIQDIDEDGSGQIEYDEFRNLLSSSDWAAKVTVTREGLSSHMKKTQINQSFRSQL